MRASTPKALGEKTGHVDDVPVLLTVLEDIRDLSEGLENCVELFRKTGDQVLTEAASVLDPISDKLALIISCEFPDLNWIRQDLIERGLEGKIVGG